MDALCVGWEKKVIGYTSDGASNMTGCVQGLGTRIGNVAGRGFFRVWCAAHQLDLIVQEVLNSMYNENSVNIIQSTCPRFITTRWLSMGKLLHWLKSKRLFVQDHLNHKNPSCKPKKD